MIIEPLPNIIYIKTESAQVGALDTSSKDTAVEYAEVIAIGEGVKLKVGDKIFVKSWAIDLISHEGQWYKFVNLESGGVLAIIREDEPKQSEVNEETAN